MGRLERRGFKVGADVDINPNEDLERLGLLRDEEGGESADLAVAAMEAEVAAAAAAIVGV